MKRQIFSYIVILLMIVSFGWGEEDDILKILKKSAEIDISKYPEYEVYDPFIKAVPAIKKSKKVKVEVAPPLPVLSAVIDDTAFIDGKWRRVGDTIKGYKVIAIKDGSVVLKLGKKSISLKVISKKHISNFKIIDRERKR